MEKKIINTFYCEIIDLMQFIFQKQMRLLMQLREDMELELNHKHIQITILTILPARQLSELVL